MPPMEEFKSLDQRHAPNPEPPEQEEGLIERMRGDMSFLDHLEELRGTLIRICLSFALGIGVVGGFIKQAADILNWPLQYALGDASASVQGLNTRGPFAVFSVIFDISMIGGLAISLPLIIYFIARFIAPGLTRRELALLRPICLAAFVLFIVGSTFSFLVLVPAALRASIFLNNLFEFQVLWSADEYYGMLLWMIIGVGVLFEFPLLVVGLVAVGVLRTPQLRRYRAHAISGFLVAAAIITPTTDPVTFLVLAVPMWLLYEGAIIVSGMIERRRAEA